MITEDELEELQNQINKHSSAIIDHFDSIIDLVAELAKKKEQFELEKRIRERKPKLEKIMKGFLDLKSEFDE